MTGSDFDARSEPVAFSPPDPRASKSAWRRWLRARRRTLTPQARRRASDRAAQRLIDSNWLKGVDVLAMYSAMPDEAEPQAVSQWHVARGGRIAFPRVEGDRLRWFLASIETLRPQPPWSILEPDPLIHSEISPNQVDAWIVPGLGFTQDGLRIGYGRGYYDRALAASTSSLKIGFAFSIQCVAKLPTASHDQRLAAVVHEEALCIAVHR